MHWAMRKRNMYAGSVWRMKAVELWAKNTEWPRL